MITCFLKYEIVPEKSAEFEHYARLWIPLVERFGGRHHGYFLPHESPNDLAIALFSFPNFATYEKYRQQSEHDPECQNAFTYARETKCIRRYDRHFLQPIFGDKALERQKLLNQS